MLKNYFKDKKKISLLLSILLISGLVLTGCNWFENGIINIFDPQAQIRVNYTDIKLSGDTEGEESNGDTEDTEGEESAGEGSISLEVYSLNEVEFIGEGFSYKYYNNGILIPELSRTVGATFYVEPSDSPGSPGPINDIVVKLYYQEVLDYVKLHPIITELTCTITLIGTDGSGHRIEKSVTFDLPVIEPGVDFIDPVANILTTPSPPSGNIPLTVLFDASGSTDNRGIGSYFWDFDDGKTSSSKTVTHVYTNPGSYIVTLTVTDYFDNQDMATVTVEAGEGSGPTAEIVTIPDPPNVLIGANLTFDGTDSSVGVDCGCGTTIESYEWNFDDGETDEGSIVTHSYTSAGTYTVTLTVTDSNGKSAVTSVEVNIT